jgi:hypothetical protein
MKELLLERMWKGIRKGAPDECWHFHGSRGGKYPAVELDGINHCIPRIMLALKTGEPQRKRSRIYRSCGDLLCCNPAHLFVYDPEKAVPGRFWPQVAKAGPDDCWEWMGEPFGDRYGVLQVNGINRAAHRISYALAYGEIPHGMWVLHRCDNRRCCNPSHLFLGTHQDNENDKVAKGRQARGDRHGLRLRPERIARGPEMHRNRKTSRGESHYSKQQPELLARGESHGRSKLTEAKVAEMRELYALGGYTYVQLGRMYGVSGATAQKIIAGQMWKHADGPITVTSKYATR